MLESWRSGLQEKISRVGSWEEGSGPNELPNNHCRDILAHCHIQGGVKLGTPSTSPSDRWNMDDLYAREPSLYLCSRMRWNTYLIIMSAFTWAGSYKRTTPFRWQSTGAKFRKSWHSQLSGKRPLHYDCVTSSVMSQNASAERPAARAWNTHRHWRRRFEVRPEKGTFLLRDPATDRLLWPRMGGRYITSWMPWLLCCLSQFIALCPGRLKYS